jgi:hypothetical protein
MVLNSWKSNRPDNQRSITQIDTEKPLLILPEELEAPESLSKTEEKQVKVEDRHQSPILVHSTLKKTPKQHQNKEIVKPKLEFTPPAPQQEVVAVNPGDTEQKYRAEPEQQTSPKQDVTMVAPEEQVMDVVGATDDGSQTPYIMRQVDYTDPESHRYEL